MVPYVVWFPVLETKGCSQRQEEGVGERVIRKVCEEHHYITRVNDPSAR